MQKIWANSGDSHFLEPQDMLRDRLTATLPPDLLERIPRTERDGEWETVYVDGEVLRRKLPQVIPDGEHAGLRMREASARPPGARDPELRLADMDAEGVWGQVVYPSLGLWNNMIKHRELSRLVAETTNDWARELMDVSPRLVCVALLPLRSVDDAIAEAARAKEIGFSAAFVPSSPPSGEPAFNRSEWAPLWAALDELGLVLTSHVGSGGDEHNLRYHGPGAAVQNYVETTYNVQRLACQLVTCGALDRHPNLRVLLSEGGSAWVPFLGDRMNEAYRQHSFFTKPKLSRLPKEILMEQVYTSFQHDETGPMALVSLGYRNGMWGDDYPHLEGTFGHTQKTLDELFGDLPAEDRHRLTIGAFAELFPHVGPPPIDEA